MSFARRRPFIWIPGLALLSALFVAPSDGVAQYFGRNKVQYRSFDFRILRTEHFDIYFYPEEEAATRDAARMAERWYARLSRVLEHEFDQRQPLILYANHPHFQQTSTYAGSISEGTGGFTEVFKQRVVMPFAYSYEETDHVLGHELVHAFQYDISGLGRAGGGLEEAAQRYQVPLWFTEGMAEYLSVGPQDAHTAMWVRDAALQGDIPSIDEMTSDASVFPYRWGQALWAYVGGRWGDASIGRILALTGQGIPYPDAFDRVLRISLDQLSDEWHTAIRRAYLPMLASHAVAREVARPLITPTRAGGRLNIAPSLSPDGEYVAFISERDFLDAELWLADARSGAIIRKLQGGTAFDSHYGSLRYINSAGSWSPDSRRFAFSALRGGSDVLAVIDVASGEREREYRAGSVGEISNPAWSPDGRSIVFSGLRGGVSDLYLLDLESGAVRGLTDDPYAEMHPAFSPDGKSIAFTTDRGPGTSFSQLRYGPYRLALYDVASGEIQTIGMDAGAELGSDLAREINPVWSRDGGSLFFVSSRAGVPNIYRRDLATGATFEITNIFTGVSGITDVSPALTSAREADRLLFTAYESGGYNIYALSDPRELAGVATSSQPAPAASSPGLLPPHPRPAEAAYNRVGRYLADAAEGLPDATDVDAFAVEPYRARLGLDYLGQPQLGVSAGSSVGGNGVSGGISGIFSDVLGIHTLYGAVQAPGELDEIGGAVQYVNAGGRWSWGGAAQRVPSVYGYAQLGSAISDEGETVPTYDLVRARFFDTRLQGFVQYPISTVRRIEASAGVHQISRDYQIYRLLLEPRTGQAFDSRRESVDGYAIGMVTGSAAFVHDDALFGYTSPFAGRRYRVQLAPMLGDVRLLHALVDLRRYIYLRPVTIALQALHNGKYGRDSNGRIGDDDEARVFYDDYLGSAWNVRGYSDSYQDCRESGDPESASCTTFTQLMGSRIAVAKVEVRFPLIRYLVVGSSLGFPPVEGFGFADAGVAWSAGTRPVIARGTQAAQGKRGWMTSAGVGARANLFGYLILEVDYVRAFALDRGWKWQFSATPGF